LTAVFDPANTQNRTQFIYHKGYIRNNHQLKLNSYITNVTSIINNHQLYMINYILYLSTTNCTIIAQIKKSMKGIRSTSTSKEATFSVIAKSCFFSNLFLIILHILPRSRSQIINAYENKGEKIGSKLNHYLQILT